MSYKIKDENGRPVIVKGQQVIASDNFESEVKDFNDKERSLLATASRATKDRMGDIIEVEGWKLKNYRKNPVVMPFHNYSVLPVGRSLEEFTKGDRLKFRPQFAPYDNATLMYSLYRDKYLKGFSVGFVDLKSEPIEDTESKGDFWGTPLRFLKMELLEVSVAPIPAHPDALSEVKSYVEKGKLYIPAKYLQEEEPIEIEETDEYIHIKESDVDRFNKLYATPIMFNEDATEATAWVVFGPHKDADESLYFNQRFIFKRDGKCNRETSAKWVKDNSTEIDVNRDPDSGVVTLLAFKKESDINLVEYNPETFSSVAPVLIDCLPTCDPTLFECAKEIKPDRTNDIVKVVERMGDFFVEEIPYKDEKKTSFEYVSKEAFVEGESMVSQMLEQLEVFACRINELSKKLKQVNIKFEVDGKVIGEEVKHILTLDEESTVIKPKHDDKVIKDEPKHIIELDKVKPEPQEDEISIDDLDVNEIKELVTNTIKTSLGKLED